jgi:hypothetical protein
VTDEAAERPSGYSRRDLLKRGAVVGAAAVWTIPLIEAVSMTPAHAESPSSPSGGGGGQVTPPPSGGVAPETITTAPAATPAAGGAEPAEAAGSLAFTGVDVPVPTAIGTATVAIALGVGALAAGAAYNKQRGGDPTPAHRD